MRILGLFSVTKSRRRHADARRVARSRQPLMEEVESRALMTALMMINNPQLTEGTGTNSTANFTVTLTSPQASPVTVNYSTFDGSANAGSDYVGTSGTLVIPAGQMSATIPVTVIGDATPETTENFGVRLYGASPNALVITPQGSATILDDDVVSAPELSISDVVMTRGLDGTKQAVFNVSLNTPQPNDIVVNASTSNINALAGVDYEAKAQTFVIPAGQTTAQFSVTVYGSAVNTGTKLFAATIGSPNSALYRQTGAAILSYGA